MGFSFRLAERYFLNVNTTTRKAPRKTSGRKAPRQVAAHPAGTIHRSIELLRTALVDLGAPLPFSDVERVAIMINEAMSVQARSFHTPAHVFDLVDPGNPRMTLAALFHDLVYYQVDHGFTPPIAASVESGIERRDGALFVRSEVAPGDRQLSLALIVFGLAPGSKLDPYGGMNEFLSALVMMRSLGAAVREPDLALTAGCIEQTIPFRGLDARGRSPAELLEERLEEADKALGLGLTTERLREGARWAVGFANRDVANFAEEDVGHFLDNTWKLLPETNPALRTQGIYSIHSYRAALQGMEGFLRALDPRTIFARHRGVPSAAEYAQMERRARRNVTAAREYLGMKLLAAAVLEAFAEASGGDAPISYFMGELDVKEKGGRLEDYLPRRLSRATAVSSARQPLDPTLYKLLAKGRASASRFDLQNSPLALFIGENVGADGVAALLAAARRMFAGDIAPRAFLEKLPGRVAAAVAEACAAMAFARRDPLLAYAQERRREGE